MTRNRGRFYSLALGAAIPLWSSMANMGEAAFNPLHALAGRWEVRNTGTGKAASVCADKGPEYRISSDGKHVELVLKRGGELRRARYTVLHVLKDRVLLFFEGERRRNEYGGPVVWWAVFDGHNRFRWRRDDWPRNNVTAEEWRRCW